MITDQEVKNWYSHLTEDERINILKEWDELKQRLCSNILIIPTGEKDWVARAIKEGERLTNCERMLRKIINEESELIEEIKWKTLHNECKNCQGTGKVREDTCCICKGLGGRRL